MKKSDIIASIIGAVVSFSGGCLIQEIRIRKKRKELKKKLEENARLQQQADALKEANKAMEFLVDIYEHPEKVKELGVF